MGRDGLFQDQGTLAGGFNAKAFAINSHGVFVGTSETPVTVFGRVVQRNHAFISDGTDGLKDLGVLPGDTQSEALAINNFGIAAGYSTGAAGTRGFRTRPDGTLDPIINTWGGNYLRANAINNKGTVAGTATTIFRSQHAFRQDTSQGMVDMGTFVGGTSSFGMAIDSNGAVAGYGDLGSVFHAFLAEKPGQLRDLGALTNRGNSYAMGMNDLGVVVGQADSADGSSHAFMWTSKDGMRDLNALLDPSLGWTLTEARAINNDGWIIGSGRLNGRLHAFAMTPFAPPVPAPPAVVLAMLGLPALITIARRRQGRTN